MTAAHPTRHRNVFTTSATGTELADLIRRAGYTPAIADAAMARRIGPMPQLPPGMPLASRVRREAAAAGVPVTAVLLVTVAILDEAATTSGLLPPMLAAVELPPTLVVGSPQRCAAVLRAAEAAVGSRGKDRSA